MAKRQRRGDERRQIARDQNARLSPGVEPTVIIANAR